MTFTDAARSGKPFRRPGWKHYLHFNDDGKIYWDHGDCASDDLRIEWLQSADWELKEREVVVTYQKFWQTYRDIRYDPSVSQYDVIDEIAKRLGITP